MPIEILSKKWIREQVAIAAQGLDHNASLESRVFKKSQERNIRYRRLSGSSELMDWAATALQH